MKKFVTNFVMVKHLYTHDLSIHYINIQVAIFGIKRNGFMPNSDYIFCLDHHFLVFAP